MTTNCTVNHVNTDILNILEKRIQRVTDKIKLHKEQYGDGSNYTFHAGWNLGYWEGRLSALEDILGIYEDKIKPKTGD